MIKIATLEDLDVLQDMCERFHLESPYSFLQVNNLKVRESISSVLNQEKTQGIVLLGYNLKEEPLGMVAGLRIEPLFSREPIASELVWYIKPEFRGSRESLRLLQAFEYWARHVAKVKMIQLACLSSLNPEKVGKLYNRMGYVKHEEAYIKEL